MSTDSVCIWKFVTRSRDRNTLLNSCYSPVRSRIHDTLWCRCKVQNLCRFFVGFFCQLNCLPEHQHNRELYITYLVHRSLCPTSCTARTCSPTTASLSISQRPERNRFRLFSTSASCHAEPVVAVVSPPRSRPCAGRPCLGGEGPAPSIPRGSRTACTWAALGGRENRLKKMVSAKCLPLSDAEITKVSV